MTTARRILLIDDEALVRDELGGLLVDEGYELVTAADGEEGLELFRSERPDMVITDVRMPRRDGLSVAATIREEDPNVPVAVVTGHGNEAMVIEALRLGVVDFIKKPVRIEDLVGALERLEAALLLAPDDQDRLPPSLRAVEQSWTYRLANDLKVVPVLIERLLRECAAGMAPAPAAELSLALRELLVNAIEHGNLGLSYADKSQALQDGKLYTVLQERAADPARSKRTVVIAARRVPDEVFIEIEDEGDGFDWRSLPDPTDPANLLAGHGRGVLLARVSVDVLRYNDKGNQVAITKRVPALSRP